MTTAAKFWTAGLSCAALIALGFLPLGAPNPAAVADAHAKAELARAQFTAEGEIRFRRAYIRHVYLRDGDAAGDLYVHCTDGAEPPRQPTNQALCKTLINRLQREDAKQEADAAKAKADW